MHFVIPFSPHIGWIFRSNKVLHPTGQPSFTAKPSLVSCSPLSLSASRWRAHSCLGIARSGRCCLSHSHSLSVALSCDASRKLFFNYYLSWIPHTGIFLFCCNQYTAIFYSQVYSFYLPHNRILYIIYYASGSFLMNLGDSLGISIFSCAPVGAPRKSRLLPPFGVIGVGIAMIWGCWQCGKCR